MNSSSYRPYRRSAPIVPTPTALRNVETLTGNLHLSESDLTSVSPHPIPECTRSQARILLNAMFEPEDFVNVVHEYHARTDENGKVAIIPKTPGLTGKASFWDKLIRYHFVPETKAGCWFRINAVTQKGSGSRGAHRDGDVLKFGHLLVEFDNLPFGAQLAYFAAAKLPILALIYSGRRSIHGILRLPCKTLAEYRRASREIYGKLHEFGVDPSNTNPSRFSRLPGAIRDPPGGAPAMQRLIYLDPEASTNPIIKQC